MTRSGVGSPTTHSVERMLLDQWGAPILSKAPELEVVR